LQIAFRAASEFGDVPVRVEVALGDRGERIDADVVKAGLIALIGGQVGVRVERLVDTAVPLPAMVIYSTVF
jgi:hypothetical protein